MLTTSKTTIKLTKKKRQEREAYSAMLRAIPASTLAKLPPTIYMDFGGAGKSKKTKP